MSHGGLSLNVLFFRVACQLKTDWGIHPCGCVLLFAQWSNGVSRASLLCLSFFLPIKSRGISRVHANNVNKSVLSLAEERAWACSHKAGKSVDHVVYRLLPVIGFGASKLPRFPTSLQRC